MDRDNKIEDLVSTMSDMYAFMHEAQPVEKIKSHARILAVIAKQTAECAYFIEEYARTKGFGMLFVITDTFTFFKLLHPLVVRTVKSHLSSVDVIIQGYQTKFVELKSAFQGRVVIETEIAIGRVESAVRRVDITVTRVLDITSGSGRWFR
jgi:hypothetical protein